MEHEKLLRNARNHCFFIGLSDSGAELCKTNSPYGLANIHFVQQLLGRSPDATFVSTPDMTITRNATRWMSGFGYGGKLTWGDGTDPLVFLDTKPNACGMLLGGLDELPDIESLIRKLHEIETSRLSLDEVEISWDFYKSNHFIDLFEAFPTTKLDFDLPRYTFVIHGSAGEFRGDTDLGFGLYHDKSPLLREMAERIATPFGTYHVLQGEAAIQYFERYKYVESFAARKRRLAAELLFGEFVEIANESHQGLVSLNEIILGCHHAKDRTRLYPLTLRGDLPAYLVRGRPNLSPETVDLLGFEKRARRLGVYERLTHTDIIPHGGGYVLPDILGVRRVFEVESKRYFEVDMLNDRGKQVISEVRELPYEYRGRRVVLRAVEVGLLEIVAKMIPQYVLKI